MTPYQLNQYTSTRWLQTQLAKDVGFLIKNETKLLWTNLGMQLSEKAICIQGFIVEMGLEWRISSLTGPYIDNNPVMVILFLQHWVEPWDADVVWKEFRGRRNGGRVSTFRLQTCARVFQEKDIWTVLLNYHLSRTHSKRWKVGEIELWWIWRALQLFKEGSRV